MSVDERQIYIRPCGSNNKDFTFHMFYEENGWNKKEPQLGDIGQIGGSYRGQLIYGLNSEKSLLSILLEPDSLNNFKKLYTNDAAILLHKILSVPIGNKFHCVHKNIHWICERISPYYYDPTKPHPHRFLFKIIEMLDISQYPPPSNRTTYFTI